MLRQEAYRTFYLFSTEKANENFAKMETVQRKNQVQFSEILKYRCNLTLTFS